MREDAYPMTAREAVVPQLLELCRWERRLESIPVTSALGRVAGRDACAAFDVPNTRTAQLDGIACRYERLVGTGGHGLVEGVDFAFCNTGTEVPDGYDTVVRIEAVTKGGAGAYDVNPLPQGVGELVCSPGSTLRAGAVLLHAHDLVTPRAIGRLVGAGISEVVVLSRPVVGFIPTGDELCPAGGELSRGKTVESNGALVAAFVEQWGGVARLWPIQPDNPTAIESSVREALESCDIVVLNAGSSRGSKDYTVQVLERVGTVLTYKVDHGPGHHTTATASHSGKPILGLVGPQGGAALTAGFYLKPLIDDYLHRGKLPPASRVTAVLAESLRCRQTIDFFQAVTLCEEDGLLVARPCGRAVERDGILCIRRGLENDGRFAAGAAVLVEVDEPGRWVPWLA